MFIHRGNNIGQERELHFWTLLLRPSYFAGQMLLMLAELSVAKVVLPIRLILGSGFHFRTETLK